MINARFEHIAFNVADMDTVADWYEQNMGLQKVRYDKGIKTFLADINGTVVLELYSNDSGPKLDLPNTEWITLHMAFAVTDIEAATDSLVAAGATIEDPIRVSLNDKMVMLRDPFGLPLQLVSRKKSLLEE